MSQRSLLRDLEAIVGKGDLLAEADSRASYELDWTGRRRGECLAVVRPSNVEQVCRLIRTCAEYDTPVIPQGGNTGLVGGGVPRGGEPQVVISARHLSEIGEVDPMSGQVTVGSGATLAALQEAARQAGFSAGLDLGARASATVGGLAACDAGGPQALRYGTARRRIAGVEAILADGSVASRLSGLPKDNAGYNLPALLVGSEGTLCFFTRIRWSLVRQAAVRTIALLALDSVQEATHVAAELLRIVPSLEMLELITEDAARLVASEDKSALPTALSPAWVMVEHAAVADPFEALATALTEIGVADRAVFAVDAAGRERMLRFREEIPEQVNRRGGSQKFDVGIPLAGLADFHGGLEELLNDSFPDGSLIFFGHLGDGNVHVNICGLGTEDDDLAAAVFGLVAAHGGTVSAEHGIGVQKVRYLHLTRSPGEIEAMRLVKEALDPDCILNPGVILERRSRSQPGPARSAAGRNGKSIACG